MLTKVLFGKTSLVPNLKTLFTSYVSDNEVFDAKKQVHCFFERTWNKVSSKSQYNDKEYWDIKCQVNV